MTDPAFRNITVGKSWPRPATPCALIPNWEGEFRDFDDWVSFAAHRLTVARNSNGASLPAICVDTLGRRCHNGKDMARARDEGTFPVRYFFECVEPQPAPPSDLVAAARAVLARYQAENPLRTADQHRDGCQCKRCEFDRLEAVLIALIAAAVASSEALA